MELVHATRGFPGGGGGASNNSEVIENVYFGRYVFGTLGNEANYYMV